MRIDHINTKAPQPWSQDVRDFQYSVLDLKKGIRPSFRDASDV